MIPCSSCKAAYFHGGNADSNPFGDATSLKQLAVISFCASSGLGDQGVKAVNYRWLWGGMV